MRNKSVCIEITPMGAPRFTRGDYNLLRWPDHKCNSKQLQRKKLVQRYNKYKDDVRLLAGKFEFPEARAHVVFHIPMPDSWSKKKKTEHFTRPHQQKPDVDNCLKAIMDIFCKSDQHIYNVQISKYWAYEGGIQIF